MRRYMVDPDNEDRLLKIPPHVVAAIKAEVLDAAREAVLKACAHTKYEGCSPCFHDDCVAAIDALKESK